MYLKHDREKALQTGLNLFKTKGFYSLGVDEICKSTGMTKGAFYNAFKSKENFLLSCLEVYGEMNVSFLSKKLTDSDLGPVDRIVEMYSGMLRSQPSSNYSGCLVNNSMSELSATNEIISKETEIIFNRLLKEIEPVIIQAQKSRDLNPKVDSYALAELIHTTFFGVLIRIKSSKDVQQGIDTITLLLKSLK